MGRTPKGREIAAGLLLAAVTLGTAGCGNQITADTTCKEFMQQSASVRDDAVNRVGAERGNSMAVTPLGRPNVEYLCAQQPDWTLGHVIDLSK